MAEYDIFLSHSSKDKHKVELIYDDLIKQNFTVWFDKENINGGDVWPQAIQEGIECSKVLVLIWTEEAKKSEWVQREIAWSLSKNIPVIPVLMDNTELNISIQTIQFIDARSGYGGAFPELVSRINRYVESEPASEKQQGRAWTYQKQPFFRSRFLEANGYLDRNRAEFATNEWTQRLFSFKEKGWEKATLFTTIVLIPLPNVVDINLAEIQPMLLKHYDENRNSLWKGIHGGNRAQENRSNSNLVLYDSRQYGTPIEARNYLRFDDNGTIELADSYDTVFDFIPNQSNKRAYGFRLISILGATWKLINFGAYYYNLFGNRPHEYQVLINLKATNTSILAGFGGNDANRWENSLTGFSFRWEQEGRGKSNDNNLQFIYNINVQNLIKSPEISLDLITHLSQKIQWAFNLDDKPRHNNPRTNEFDWMQFPREFI